MAEPVLAVTRLAGTAGDAALLVVGPSLGTAVAALWEDCAARVGGTDPAAAPPGGGSGTGHPGGYQVIGWDLPGHGASPPATASFTVAELAAAVQAVATAAAAGRPACYAGVSLGGTVAYAIAPEPGPFLAAAAIASASSIGDPPQWKDRAETVRKAGTAAIVPASAGRWFAPGFTERDPGTAGRLLQTLADADDESYALACEALAGFDRRRDLGRMRIPFLLGPGEHDGVVPPARTRQDAAAMPGSQLEVFAGCGHLPPAEDPAAVAAELAAFFAARAAPGPAGSSPGRPPGFPPAPTRPRTEET